jgi:hypothetical protein
MLIKNIGYSIKTIVKSAFYKPIFNRRGKELKCLMRGINFEDKVVLITDKDKLKSVQDQEAEKLVEIRKNTRNTRKSSDSQLEFSPEAQSTPRLPEI